MEIITNGKREDAIHALINTWLKLEVRICDVCGTSDPTEMAQCYDRGGQGCVIGSNKEILALFLKHDIPLIRSQRRNKWASNKQMDIRYTVSLPQRLYTFLDQAMMRNYQERLFTDEHNHQWFARKFPQFAVPEEL